MTIIPSIDLRPRLGSIRHQGNRPTCLAFALSELNRFHANAPAVLSPEFLYAAAARAIPGWQPHDGLTVPSGLHAAAAPGQPHDDVCPYTANEPAPPWTPLPAYNPMYATTMGVLPHTVPAIESVIAKGVPVGLGVNLTVEFYTPQDGVVVYSPYSLPDMGHAVIAVGWGQQDTTDEPYVLIRNSWGKDWGEDGYAWIPTLYLETHGLCAFGV